MFARAAAVLSSVLLVWSSANADDAKAPAEKKAANHDPRSPDGSFKYTNRLSKETSPYLLQHAHNPVDWHPWGDAAFELAKKEGRPVFMSIGYSTCHWCHVMERESFSDEAVAKILNEKFVCIKVDREERPDVDAAYMNAVRLMNGGGGGWPLTVFLTPERKPFFGLTYLPPEDKNGRTGLKTLLKLVDEAWKDKDKRAEIEKGGESVVEALRKESVKTAVAGAAEVSADAGKKGAEYFVSHFDIEYGGFGGGGRFAPKFPRSHVYSWLLRQAARPGTPAGVVSAVTKSLDAMAAGGMYDHLGGGFHRYSTDRQWLVPHFEKMLYDQALIARTYLEAHQVTGSADYSRVAREIFDYVLRDMTHAQGGFFSAEDADSEGVEGKFYVWTAKEIDAVLGADGPLFRRYYGVGDKPNFEEADGSILHVGTPARAFAGSEKLTPADLEAKLSAARKKLLAVRAKRIRPHLDDKVLAGWNGLMIGALAFGADVLDEPQYRAAADRAADFVLKNLRRPDGRLLVAWRNGQADKPAYLDDYAYLSNALLDLYESGGDPARLKQARGLIDDMIKLFADPAGGFLFSGKDGEKLIAANREIYDGALPSGNSVAALALLRLAQLTGEDTYGKYADGLFKAFAAELSNEPWAYPQMMIAWDFRTGPTMEIVLAGDRSDPTLADMLRVVRGRFLPNKVLAVRPPDGPAADAVIAQIPWLKEQKPIGGKATAYVCRNRACELPVHTIDHLNRLLSGK